MRETAIQVIELGCERPERPGCVSVSEGLGSGLRCCHPAMLFLNPPSFKSQAWMAESVFEILSLQAPCNWAHYSAATSRRHVY